MNSSMRRIVSIFGGDGSSYTRAPIPTDTLGNNGVVITSKWRHFDVITSQWHRLDVIMYYVMCQMGNHQEDLILLV